MSTSHQSQSALAQADSLMAERGFDVRSVIWGYQELFREAIAELIDSGFLTSGPSMATDVVFETLAHVDKSIFDSVVKAYLEALTSPYRWIMRLPRLFERWSATGLRLAHHRHFLGIKFFRNTAAGMLGQTPSDIDVLLDQVALLLDHEPEAVGPLLDGYGEICRALAEPEIRTFVLESLQLFRRNPSTGRDFLAVNLSSARERLRSLSSQARLSREKAGLERLLQALCSQALPVDNLRALDSDDLILRGSTLVACRAGVYLPEVVQEFGSIAANRRALKTLTVVAGAAIYCNSFAAFHGAPGINTCDDLLPGEQEQGPLSICCYLAEVARILHFCRTRLPGCRPTLGNFVHFEFEHHPPKGIVEDALQALCLEQRPADGEKRQIYDTLARIARTSDDLRRTIELVNQCGLASEPWFRARTARLIPRPLVFFPDPYFLLKIKTLGDSNIQFDLHDQKKRPDTDREEDGEDTEQPDAPTFETEEKGEDGVDADDENKMAAPAGYFYDEWNQHAGDYYQNWCCVHEHRAKPRGRNTVISPELEQYTSRIRRIFERLKPEEMRNEQRLLEGDSIQFDHFMEYISQGTAKRSTEMRFYSKPLTTRRDVAIALLLDLSGSTAEECPQENGSEGNAQRMATRSPADGHAARAVGRSGIKSILDVEKEAAYVLSEGLSVLGDTFAIYGFTGSGRENGQFAVFKNFGDAWERTAADSLLSAGPGSSTRIGPALRHAGWHLLQRPAKSKLLLVITDGKPCDQGYDAETQYAHHDVRKACQENQRHGIHTFCISLAENTPADMELMFPNGRYLILETISRLPDLLSRLYLQLTR